MQTAKEISPEIKNMIADRLHLPQLKGYVNSNGQYYESRWNPLGNQTFQEYLSDPSNGWTPFNYRGDPIRWVQFNNSKIPVKQFVRKNNGITESLQLNPYQGGRIHKYNVSGMSTTGVDLGDTTITRTSYGWKTPGGYKLNNEFDMALTANDIPTIDKNILKVFGRGIIQFTPKKTRISGDMAPSIADRTLSEFLRKNYKSAFQLATQRPMLPTNNALSTDSYRWLTSYGQKYPGFKTFYDGYDSGYNNAGAKFLKDKEFLRTNPELLNQQYLQLDPFYPGIQNGKLPHPWIVKKE